jgi:hypothetical protein
MKKLLSTSMKRFSTFKTKSNSKYKKKEKIQNEFLKEQLPSSKFDLGPIDENESAKQAYMESRSNLKFDKELFNEFFGFDSKMNPIEKKESKRMVENQIEFFNQIDKQGIEEDKDEKVNTILKNYKKIKEEETKVSENMEIISFFISKDKWNEEMKWKWNQRGYDVLNVIPWMNELTIQLVKKEEEKKVNPLVDVKLKIKELIKKNPKKSSEILKKLLKDSSNLEEKDSSHVMVVEKESNHVVEKESSHVMVEEKESNHVVEKESNHLEDTPDFFSDFKKFKMNHGNTRIPSSLEEKINALIKGILLLLHYHH